MLPIYNEHLLRRKGEKTTTREIRVIYREIYSRAMPAHIFSRIPSILIIDTQLFINEPFVRNSSGAAKKKWLNFVKKLL